MIQWKLYNMALRLFTMQRSLKGWHFTQDNSAWKLDLNFDRTVLRLTRGCSNYFFVPIWSIFVHFMYISGDRFVYICPFLPPQKKKKKKKKNTHMTIGGQFYFLDSVGWYRRPMHLSSFLLHHASMPECSSLGLKNRTQELYVLRRYPHRHMTQSTACPSYVILQASWLPTEQCS